MDDGLQGRTALVTGGARRVGAAIARRLHGAGANLVLHYRDSAAEADKLAGELNAQRAKEEELAGVTAGALERATPKKRRSKKSTGTPLLY